MINTHTMLENKKRSLFENGIQSVWCSQRKNGNVVMLVKFTRKKKKKKKKSRENSYLIVILNAFRHINVQNNDTLVFFLSNCIPTNSLVKWIMVEGVHSWKMWTNWHIISMATNDWFWILVCSFLILLLRFLIQSIMMIRNKGRSLIVKFLPLFNCMKHENVNFLLVSRRCYVKYDWYSKQPYNKTNTTFFFYFLLLLD